MTLLLLEPIVTVELFEPVAILTTVLPLESVPMFVVLVVDVPLAPVLMFSVVPLAVLEPNVTAVAEPKAFTVDRFVLKSVSVPVELVAMVGLAPFMFSVVAFESVTVAFATVAVPVDEPKFNDVAAPKAFTVVAFVLKTLNVVEAAALVTLVVNSGDVPKTSTPEPVSSEIIPASCAEVVDANWLKFPVVAKVTVPDGRVALVVPVVVSVSAKFPDVVKLFAISRLPPRTKLLAAFSILIVNVLSAVKIGFDVAAIATSNAAEVSLTLRDVRSSAVPPFMSGAVKVLLVKVCTPVRVAYAAELAATQAVPFHCQVLSPTEKS